MEKGNFWRRLVNLLPLYAAEGGQYTEVDASNLLKGAQGSEAAMLTLVQELLGKAGVLDASRLVEGKWRFVSYPARLFACSLLSLLANEKSFFGEGFWAADVNDSIAAQHRVLHSLETLRSGTVENFPIRRTFVAWGIIKRGRNFVLKRRENPESDPDNKLHGNYGFPGGRVNLRDLEACGMELPMERMLTFLYGVPEPMTEEEKGFIAQALERALVRELREELGLEYKIHYTFSKAQCPMPPQTFIHGANAHHCMTECHITLYDIALTSEGDAFLASRMKNDLFTMEEILSPWSDERKVFFDTSDLPLRTYLENLPDSSNELQVMRSELSDTDAKNKKNAEPVHVILPLSPKEPLILGGCEIPLPDQRYTELLLLLGLAAREGFQMRLLSNSLERKNWGWLLLDQDLRTLANKCNQDIARMCGAPLLFIHNSLCRLRLNAENIFFSPGLFRAELKDTEQAGQGRGELILVRRSLDFPGLFHLDSENYVFELSSYNYEHLRNLANGSSDLVTYDNLRKLRTRGNQRLDDLARQYGLYKLYESSDHSVSKELQEIRFAVHVD